VRNVFWLRPGVIGGRTGPNKDSWDPYDLADAGIDTIISVNDGDCVNPGALEAAGIDYKCVPLSDCAPPMPGDLEVCTSALPVALEFACKSIESNRSVIVHCRSGKDRTGMFLSYYLCKVEGLGARDAIEEVKRVRPIALTAEGWESFTHEVLAALDV